MERNIIVYITIIIVLWFLLILYEKVKKIKLGKVIVTLPKPIYEYFIILIAIFSFIVSYLQIRDIFNFNRDFSLLFILSLLVNIAATNYLIYIALAKNEIRELGIYMKNHAITWNKIKDYKIIDYSEIVKHYETTYCKLQLKVELFTIMKKEMYWDVTIQIDQNQKEIISNILEKSISNQNSKLYLCKHE